MNVKKGKGCTSNLPVQKQLSPAACLWSPRALADFQTFALLVGCSSKGPGEAVMCHSPSVLLRGWKILAHQLRAQYAVLWEAGAC